MIRLFLIDTFPFQIPCNQLMQMNPYQRRVQASMERLSVPSWYNPLDNPSPSSASPHTPRWRQTGGRSSSSSTGWRRHLSQPPSSSTSPTPERNSRPLSSQRYKSRCTTLPQPRKPPQPAGQKPYLGWRQEAAEAGSVTGPAQRLARSATLPRVRLAGVADRRTDLINTPETGDDDMEENNNENAKRNLVDILSPTVEYLSPTVTV